MPYGFCRKSASVGWGLMGTETVKLGTDLHCASVDMRASHVAQPDSSAVSLSKRGRSRMWISMQFVSVRKETNIRS